MPTFFLTSSPMIGPVPAIDPRNGLIDELRNALRGTVHALFLCADPDSYENNAVFAGDMKRSLEGIGILFDGYEIIDHRWKGDFKQALNKADLVVFGGGHVPTQNRFLKELNARACFEGYEGVVIGISAGSMNAADTVYAIPEEPGEALSDTYERFIQGVGIAETMIIPHYQKVNGTFVDGFEVITGLACPDSAGRTFIALPDGSYILGKDGKETVMGEARRIADGSISLICREGESLILIDGGTSIC